MAEKTRYSDAELEEFRSIIMEKLDKAKRDYDLLREGIFNSEGNDVSDTSPTFKVMARPPPLITRRLERYRQRVRQAPGE